MAMATPQVLLPLGPLSGSSVAVGLGREGSGQKGGGHANKRLWTSLTPSAIRYAWSQLPELAGQRKHDPSQQRAECDSERDWNRRRDAGIEFRESLARISFLSRKHLVALDFLCRQGLADKPPAPCRPSSTICLRAPCRRLRERAPLCVARSASGS